MKAMEKFDPFSQEALNELFKISPKRSDCVNSRESSTLEFKESFSFGSMAKYTKTCVAFANTKGGYIIFGIANRPHKLVGLKKRSIESFENIDPEKVSGFFNEHFAPEIQWEIHIHEIHEKPYGLLYIHESSKKPVVCAKDAGEELKEGDIYYRYRGRTTRIRYPELRSIIDERRESEERLWLNHLLKIARIGVRETGIFDLQTGTVTGTNGSFVIDESLLSQLSFIKEGAFSEVKGKPTLKLIGTVEPVEGGQVFIGQKQIIKSKGIRIGDIVLAFLDQNKIAEPKEYIKQICFETTGFLPVYYFMKLAEINRDNAVELAKNAISRSQAKDKLIERITTKRTQIKSLPALGTSAARKKQGFIDQAKVKKISSDLSGKNLNYCLQAFRTLKTDEVKKNSEYIRGLLKTWFNKYYSSGDGTLADNLRRTICWIDEALYMEDLK